MNLSFLKPALLSLLLLFQLDSHRPPSYSQFRYQRTVTLTPLVASRSTPAPGQACAVLDAPVFAHSAASLKDLRLYSGQTEVPYAITISEPAQQEAEDARILNLGLHSGRIVFDLEMPHRPYSAVVLDLAAQDFFATANVSGSSSPGSKSPANLGTFTLFDLTSQHLARSTTLPLAESTLPYLHVELALTPVPGSHAVANSLNRSSIVRAATVPPSREAQTVYTTLQQSSAISQRGQKSVATFAVPVRTPIERIAVVLDPTFKGNFSRSLEIDADAQSSSPTPDAAAPEVSPQPGHETVAGSILRVHLHPAGRETYPDISVDRLTIPAAIGSNMQHPATVDVAIDNGANPPLPIAAIQLQMRQRLICFDSASAAKPLTLYYGGDNSLDAPAYEYDRLFQASAKPRPAALGAETLNASFTGRASSRDLNARHPELFWLGLLAFVCLVALIAIYKTKRHSH